MTAYGRAPADEYTRLILAGVRPSIAEVLTSRQPGDDVRAYWRAIAHRQRPTPAQYEARRQLVRRARAAALPRQAPRPLIP